MSTSKLWLLAVFASLTWGAKAQNINPNDVQVHEQYTNIVSDCKKIGPLNKTYRPSFVDAYTSNVRPAVIKMAQVDAAKMGGDTLVVVRVTPDMFGVQGNFQGIVMQCYEAPKNSQNENLTNELTKKSALGDVEAMVNLAYMYLNGNGVQRSVDKAYELYKTAAKLGNKNAAMAINAQINLGYINEFGLIGQKNYEKALMWYLLSNLVKNDSSEKRIINLKNQMSDSQIKNSEKMMKICMVNGAADCDLRFDSDWKVCEIVKIEDLSNSAKQNFDSSKIGVVFNKKIESNFLKAYLIEDNSYSEIDFLIDDNNSSGGPSEYIEYKAKSGWGVIKENRVSGDLILNFGKKDGQNMSVFTKCQ